MYENLWSKSVWIPFWALQLISAAIYLALSAVGLGIWKASSDDYDSALRSSYSNYADRIDNAVYILSGVYIGISAVTIVVNVVEIVLFARKRLSPVSAVIFNSITTVLWLGMLGLLVFAAVGGTASIFSWIVIMIASATSIGKLAYGSVILHRSRKRFAHPKGAYTSASTDVDLEFDSSPNGPYTSYNAGGTAATSFRHDVPIPHQYANGAAGQYLESESLRNSRYA